jgi:rfaE bifunctional protein nucleotidyltransferase chain/domain
MDKMKQQCALWRSSDLKIVLTNGAFDLLHVGHLRYLAAAKELGDRLIVAVNSDLSVRLSKGPKRPIVPEAERVELLRHIGVIDHLFLFDDLTVGPVLEALRPAIHAKGTDYTVDTVPERKIVEAYGGRTAICGDPKDHATTDVIAVILERFGDGAGSAG